MRSVLTGFVHETIGRIMSFGREIWYSLSLRNVKDGIYEVLPKPPYLSQIANARRSKIKGFYQFINDQDAAKRFGTSDLDEFSYWAWRSCGVVGVQMVLKAQLGHRFVKSTMDLVREGLLIGGYDVAKDKGWYHVALAQIANEHSVDSCLSKFVPASQIARLVLGGNYVLASVKNKHGGHLLLIWGVRIRNGKLVCFLIHDPNNFSKDGDSREISKSFFENLSTRRIIVFNNKKLC